MPRRTKPDLPLRRNRLDRCGKVILILKFRRKFCGLGAAAFQGQFV
jgi:hypothetical protein